jgi:hypothetical protein
VTEVQRRRDGRVQSYPVATMSRARELHAAEWTPTEVRGLLEQEGHPVPSVKTLQKWFDPKYGARQLAKARALARAKRAETAVFRLPSSRPEYQKAFMVVLRRQGLSYRDIAVVASIVFGARLSAEQARYRITGKVKEPRRRQRVGRCGCGAPLPYSGMGRPRKSCDECRARR